MAHPYASQAKASQKARLGRLGAKAGKSFGSSSMYKATSYPSKGAGSSTPLTISGGAASKRADRAPQKFASGGFVGGGTKKKSRKGHSTTNIVIASPGGGGGPQAVPVPRPVPVPVPVGAGGPPPMPPRPPMAPPGAGAGGPPVNVNVPPPAAAPPMPGARPPGLAAGGTIKGSTYHNWGKGFANGGSVKKKASGGPVTRGQAPPDPEDDPPPNPLGSMLGGGSSMDGGTGIGGGDSFVPPTGLGGGGGRNFKKGGAIKKRQFGGGTGQPGLGPQIGGPRKPFVPGAAPGQRPGAPGARPPVVPLTGGRPTRPGYKDGGKAKKYADGGDVEEETTPPASSDATKPGGGIKGVMDAATKLGKSFGPTSSPSGGDAVRAAQGAQTAAEKAGQAVAGSMQALGRGTQSGGFKPGAVPGAGGNIKAMFNKGGSVKGYKAGGATGQGRLDKIAGARKVPDKTEV